MRGCVQGAQCHLAISCPPGCREYTPRRERLTAQEKRIVKGRKNDRKEGEKQEEGQISKLLENALSIGTLCQYVVTATVGDEYLQGGTREELGSN